MTIIKIIIIVSNFCTRCNYETMIDLNPWQYDTSKIIYLKQIPALWQACIHGLWHDSKALKQRTLANLTVHTPHFGCRPCEYFASHHLWILIAVRPCSSRQASLAHIVVVKLHRELNRFHKDTNLCFCLYCRGHRIFQDHSGRLKLRPIALPRTWYKTHWRVLKSDAYFQCSGAPPQSIFWSAVIS